MSFYVTTMDTFSIFVHKTHKLDLNRHAKTKTLFFIEPLSNGSKNYRTFIQDVRKMITFDREDNGSYCGTLIT
jgi:hypothetical protein